MPTKRRKIGPRKINRDTPPWAVRFLEDGVTPKEEEDPEGHDQWVGWAFFGESVSGLPDERSPEGQRLAWGG